MWTKYRVYIELFGDNRNYFAILSSVNKIGDIAFKPKLIFYYKNIYSFISTQSIFGLCFKNKFNFR